MKKRLDLLLVERGLAETRSRAQALVMAGRVRVGGEVVAKAGVAIDPTAAIDVAEPEHPWVGRGGIKLAAALDAFAIDPAGRICLDLGASTGGFTDVLLVHGARRVFAVDVGWGQLHQRLREDDRVVVLERTNARHLDRTLVPEPIEIVTADLAFISVTLVLPVVAPLLAARAEIVVLVKPQFESERGEVGRGGIVRDAAVRERALARVEAAGRALGWEVIGSRESPIRGRDGNVELLLALRTG